MKIYNAAIIGYGRSGRDIHASVIKKLPGRFRVAAVAEPDAGLRERARAELGCDVYDDYRKLFGRNDIDFAINCAYSSYHAPIAIDLFNHGFNVLQEKPAAMNAAEFVDILDAMKKSGKFLHIFQPTRYTPGLAIIAGVMQSGKLGRIVQCSFGMSNFARRWDWQTVRKLGGGSLHNAGAHVIDMVIGLLNITEMPDVHCLMDRAQSYGDAEDYIKMILSGGGLPVIDIEISCCNKYFANPYLIQGTRGTLTGDVNEIEWSYYIDDDEKRQDLTLEPLVNAKGEPVFCREELTFHNEKWQASGDELNIYEYRHMAFYDEFYNAINDGADYRVKPGQVLLQLQIMDIAMEQNKHMWM
jgi:predicted dehydrogenase